MSDVPGDAGAIAALAQHLENAAQVAERQESRLVDARRVRWAGEAADAYCRRVGTLADGAADVATRLRSASATLQRYAETLTRHRSAILTAEHRLDRARDEAAGDPLNLGRWTQVLRAGLAVRAELNELEQAAVRAATELATLAEDPGWGDSWWDPFGFFDDHTVPTRDVGDDVVEKSSFEPWDIQQREIGSCSLLSTLSSLMRTDGGDQWLRDNVRWDEEADGYWVTLYEDGRPFEVFVDKVYKYGANQRVDNWLWDGSRPSIASLYETAVAQHLGFADLDDGISRLRAAELVTGRTATEYSYVYPGPNSAAWKDVVAALRRSDPVTAGTVHDVLGDGSWDIEVQRRNGHGDLVTDEITLQGNHAYAVIGAEPDGSVWVVNPWGPGNGADGGGPFLVSPEIFGNLFYGVACGELPR